MEHTTAPPSTPQPLPSEAEPTPLPPLSSSPTPPPAANASSVALPSPATPSLPPPASTTPLQSHPSPTQNSQPPATATPPSQTTPQVRPSAFNRPWQSQQQQQQQQQPLSSSPFAPYSLPPVPAVPHNPPSSANSASPSIPILPPSTQRGGMAIGVPAAHHPGAPPPVAPASFPPHNPPFGQAFGGIRRDVTDSGPTSSSPQAKPTVGGNQGMGMMGSSSPMRPPAGGSATPLRAVQSSPRPQSNPSIQSPHAQSLQGHAMLRPTSVGSPGAQSPGPPQSPQPQNQPWLNSGSQARQPLPPTSLRPQITPLSLQPRLHVPHHSANTTSQQQQASPAQQSQQPSTSGPQEHHGQHPQSKIQQSSPNQQQIARSPSVGTQRPSQTTIPSTSLQSSLVSRGASAEPEESCNRILRKRSIQELVTQVDPSEKLDPEVEDILVDIAEDFVESITSFGCSLAKHRQSTTLEGKDILLHLERNWDVTLPGFSGDEIKTYRKPFTSDIHRERLAVIKKSILAGDTMNSKSTAGQAGGNPKGHLAKGPANLVGSPPTKVRESA